MIPFIPVQIIGSGVVYRAKHVAIGLDGTIHVHDFDNCIQTIYSKDKRDKRAPLTLDAAELAFHPKVGTVVVTHQGKVIRQVPVTLEFKLLYEAHRGTVVQRPTDVAVSPDGTVYLCDPENGVILALRRP